MTSGREITPTPGFLAVPITTTMFAATTPENTPLAYRASTSANPNLVISLAFVKANYESLESLLRDRCRKMRNNDLQTELEYFGEDYDGEREMEPRPEPTRAATPPLRLASPSILRRGERIMGFEGAQSRGESRVERNTKRGRPSKEAPRGNGGFVHGLRTRSLVEHLSTDLPSTYKVLMEKTYTWVESSEVATNGASSDRRDSFESTKEILTTKKASRSFKPLPNMFGSKRSRDMSKYCHFHEDYGYDTNDLAKVNNAPVIIEAKIFGRNVGREYMDSGSSCEIIYEHFFVKLYPTIKATKVDLKTPLVGFSRERSWSIGEVPLEITKGDAPLSRIETLNFVIVSHVKPIKQSKRGLGPDRNMAACKETKELTKARILRKGQAPNMGATYQRLVDKFFSHQIGRNLEAYVDDMVIKRHLITKHGIKSNLSKVKAVTDLDQPRTLKDIQSLNGKLAALSRFLSKGTKRSLAFFKVLKGFKDKKSIQWTTEADKALEKMNKLVQALPTLTAPRVGETLTIHLAASKESIRRVAKWAIELGEHDIVFLRMNEKETPADFLVEIPFEDNEKKEKPKELPDSNSNWRLYTDRASKSDGSGAGLMLINPEGKGYTYALRFEFETTNNEAK
ncbi:reverse transcriptase domain-containing protein [Tanacetum coccineum]